MLARTMIRGFDRRRLRYLLLLFFVALVLPTAVLIWQAYGQLKWEAFHQHRGMAEELSSRIDAELAERILAAEARSFADYSFLVLTGDPSANFLQRSPLAEYPVAQELPGIVGYFQVGAAGEFSTPLLPQDNADPEALGIGAAEYAERLLLAQHIKAVLADNQLVNSRLGDPDPVAAASLRPALPSAATTSVDELIPAVGASVNEAEKAATPLPGVMEETVVQTRVVARASADDGRDLILREPSEGSEQYYSQQVFDQLSDADSPAGAEAAGGRGETDVVRRYEEPRKNSLGKVADLNLNQAYEKKSEMVEQQRLDAAEESRPRQSGTPRAKRVEANSLPEVDDSGRKESSGLDSGFADLRISTFASEVDPFEFSLLGSGHFVLFRKVWRDGERYIQGMLIDQRAFVMGALEQRFRDIGLSGVTHLIVAYQDDVIQNIAGSSRARYPNGSESFDGDLLYRSRLSAPLGGLELIFGINRLPPGPGASVLGWVTLSLAIVFCGGFYALYRLGLSQIDLARQQQDFVSAVSHELKTPLTSIRMYGEMLKEGWADAEKRQHYYEFIHDESERLTRLISNVLQLASITRNEPQLDLQPLTAARLMRDLQSKISAQVAGAGFEFAVAEDASAEQATIVIDQDCFAQIVINLVDNAIKFSAHADRKRIEIGNSLTSDRRLLITVRDFGPGVPRDQMKRIFRLFYRTESELTRETVGTGIGLAIVHQLTVAMGGTVDVINRDPGAEFRVSFPLQG